MLNSVHTLSHVILPTEKLCPFHKKSRVPDRDYTPSKNVHSVKLRSLLSSKLCLQIGRGPILSTMIEVCSGCRENKRGASQTLSGVQDKSQTLLAQCIMTRSPNAFALPLGLGRSSGTDQSSRRLEVSRLWLGVWDFGRRNVFIPTIATADP